MRNSDPRSVPWSLFPVLCASTQSALAIGVTVGPGRESKPLLERWVQTPMNSPVFPNVGARRGAFASAVGGEETADACASIASMLEKVRDFAELALKEELNGGHFQDEAGAIVDRISDAIGEAKAVAGDLTAL